MTTSHENRQYILAKFRFHAILFDFSLRDFDFFDLWYSFERYELTLFLALFRLIQK